MRHYCGQTTEKCECRRMPENAHKMVGEFEINNKESGAGTSFHGIYITVDPNKLIALLGNGVDCDDYKVSMEWTFINDGRVFTLYDWKETCLYDRYLPSPPAFWCGDVVRLHIGHLRENKDLALELAGLLESLCGVEK